MSVKLIDSINFNLFTKRNKSRKNDNLKVLSIKYVPIFFIFLLIPNIILKFIFIALWWLFATIFFDHRQITVFRPTIRVWFGVPGAGKTSVAAWLTRNSIKNHYKVLSNVNIKGAYILDEEDLGRYDMSFNGDGCHVIYDEASAMGLDNREFKTFSKDKKLYFSTHRHQENRVDVFSQAYDIDLKIKERAEEYGMYMLKRLPVPGFVMYRCIKKVMLIRKEDKQIIDGFKFSGLPRIVYTRSVWGSFDTKDMSMCPKLQKKWVKWDEQD